LRAIVTAGPQAANAVGEAWTDLLKSADPAKRLVSSTLDGPETAFFGPVGASRPSRARVNAVGPVAAFVVMAAIGIPLALVAYFFYSSLSTPHATTPPF
jgi:hypothetical protein